MNNEVFEELKKLMSYFPDSFINRQLELILISKVLMWCTRDIAKVRPYQQKKRNIDFYVDNRDRLRKYLGSDINVHVVYNHLGNGINKELTHRFIESGFDIDLLYKEVIE